MERIIGLDIGDVRIGVAISDELGITAQGLPSIERKGIEKDIENIKKIIEANDIKTVVAGLPKMMNGTIGIQAQKVIDFVNIMKSMINIPISFQDERLTTVEVEKRMIEANVRRNKRRETADRLAAQLILQGYLDRNRSYGFLSLMSVLWLLLFCILIFITAVYIHREVTTPASSAGAPRVIYVPKGSNLKTVSSILKNEGIISNSTIFNLLVRYNAVEEALRAGEYELSTDMTPLQVLDKILSGRVYQYPVTIPEGYNIFEIASLLDKKELADREKIILLSFNKEFVKSLGIESDNLEGYIFPDTYYINRGMDEKLIIKKMVDNFRKAVSSEKIAELKGGGITLHQLITLASLIEKETGKESEKPLISAVFYNRFKKGMKLQCDPTVIYALLLKGFKEKSYLYDGDIKKEDLLIDSPYNTYKYAGLPPAPIANPGKSSIHAAVYPLKSNYLYFVSKQNGWHHFSSTIEEHNRAVKIYQLKKLAVNK